jgi:hypothetical protein
MTNFIIYEIFHLCKTILAGRGRRPEVVGVGGGALAVGFFGGAGAGACGLVVGRNSGVWGGFFAAAVIFSGPWGGFSLKNGINCAKTCKIYANSAQIRYFVCIPQKRSL